MLGQAPGGSLDRKGPFHGWRVYPYSSSRRTMSTPSRHSRHSSLSSLFSLVSFFSFFSTLRILTPILSAAQSYVPGRRPRTSDCGWWARATTAEIKEELICRQRLRDPKGVAALLCCRSGMLSILRAASSGVWAGCSLPDHGDTTPNRVQVGHGLPSTITVILILSSTYCILSRCGDSDGQEHQ